MKNVLYLTIVLFLFSCNNEATTKTASDESNLIYVEGVETEKQAAEPATNNEMDDSAKEWLISTIENYFHPVDGEHADISSFSTDEYTEFKQDAMNLNNPEYSEAEFREKWKHKNVDLIGMQNGFMISAQDYHTVKVTECSLKKKIDNDTWIFNVIVEDLVYKGKYIREVIVAKAGNSFIINDVAEIDEILPE